MLITGIDQPVTPAERGQGLHPEAQGMNFPNAGQGESLLESCVFEPWASSWRYGKEQFIILASGQREVHRVQLSRGCVGTAGWRYRERAQVNFSSDMAFLADMAEVAGEAV